MYLVASVRPFVCVFVRAQQKANTLKLGLEGGHYQSRGFVCVSVL